MRALLCLVCMWSALLSAAETPDADLRIRSHLHALAQDDADARQAALDALVALSDGRAADAVEAWFQGSLYLYRDQAVIGEEVEIQGLAPASEDGGEATVTVSKGLRPLDPLTRSPLSKDPLALDLLTPIACSRKERRAAGAALTVLRLADPDPAKRLVAVGKAGDLADAKTRAALSSRLAVEDDAKISRVIAESLALIDLASASDDTQRISAIEALGDLKSARGAARLRQLQESDTTLSADATTAITAALARIDNWQSIARGFGHLFSGLSLGSILILMALGLSIIFGLMGVINMAHGEMMMIGAYSMWGVQQCIGAWCPPGMMEYSLLISLPIAFCAAACIGWLIEALVIRWLYGRPLDTLLATVGVGYILVQAVRLLAGNNNAIQAPSWLSGGWEVAPDIILPYNRLFILGLCAAIVVGMHLLINRSKMGLLLRATTQNRMMAQALGVRTRRIDGMTFGLGCGIAGLAGCALTLTDILKPDMGSTYIIESFMVVTAGGVGKLAGAIIAGFGLGFFNKALEPVFQAVWAKVWMLLAVIVLLQWRPSGLFPAKGRLADV